MNKALMIFSSGLTSYPSADAILNQIWTTLGPIFDHYVVDVTDSKQNSFEKFYKQGNYWFFH